MKIRSAGICIVIALAPLVHAQSSQSSGERQSAMQFFEQQRYIDALPLLEKLAAENPKDVVVHERLAYSLSMKALTIPDPDQRHQMRARARQIALEAKALGDNSQILQSLLEMPENGADSAPFSGDQSIERITRDAESAYTQHRWDDAIAGYKKALEMDPQGYYAALFLGDVYFKQKDHDQAVQWFRRAIEINPDIETAHRYWADDIAAQGKTNEALPEYVEAIVAEPYKRTSWTGLVNWAQRSEKQIYAPQIKSPNAISNQGEKQTDITLDINSLNAKDGSEKWMLYEITRAAWQTEAYKKEFPKGKYRHSLKEESQALGLVADQVAEEVSQKKIKHMKPELATLVELKRKGLLESYILISRADDGIAQDYVDYRKDHRDQLRQYLRGYLIHQEPAAAR